MLKLEWKMEMSRVVEAFLSFCSVCSCWKLTSAKAAAGFWRTPGPQVADWGGGGLWGRDLGNRRLARAAGVEGGIWKGSRQRLFTNWAESLFDSVYCFSGTCWLTSALEGGRVLWESEWVAPRGLKLCQQLTSSNGACARSRQSESRAGGGAPVSLPVFAGR